jgi:hypothetical protein
MKLKMVIVDLEIPPRVKKWGLRIGVSVGVLTAGAVALAGTPLHVWNTGDTLQAADLNANFSNLQGQIQAFNNVVSALVTATASGCTVSQQTGSWLTTCVRASVGNYQLALPASSIVANGNCIVTSTNAFLIPNIEVGSQSIVVALSGSQDSNFYIMCQ